MKRKKVETFWGKISLIGCNLSILNAPGTETPVSHPIWGDSLVPFSAPAASFLPLSGVIKNWTSQYKRKKGGEIFERNMLNRLKMAQFECPKVRNPCVSFTYGDIPLPMFSSAASFLPLSLSLPIIKKWFIMGGWGKGDICM